MKTLAKKALARAGLLGPAARVYWGACDGVSRLNRRRVARRYFAESAAPKLHLACGNHPLDGWLNTDLRPRAPGVMLMDMTRPFPFPDASFVRAYSEHAIEYVPFPSAARALTECFRVLIPGGRIRVSTPDLAFLVDLWRAEDGERSDLQTRYLEWASAELEGKGAAFVVNHFMRSGHEFIYDEPTLRAALESAGFTQTTRQDLNESGDAALRNLENEGRIPAGFLRLESLILEAVKPPDG